MRTLLLILLVGATLLTQATTEDKVEQVEVEEVVGTGGREEEGEVPVVMTSTGKTAGVRERSTGGKVFFSYYSIPFAKPPTGALRFKDPEMIQGWGGVREGSSLPPKCPQVGIASLLTGKSGIAMEGDEDCLYLNIFTPKAVDEAPLLPVMVFLHGGGYVSGSTTEYPPHVILNRDVVLVTVQYRLGVLGFMSTEDDVAPGNLGLKDQTLALSWLQRNAPKFGGDPLRVTLFGESAGGASVHLQVLTPRSIGGPVQARHPAVRHALSPWAMGAKHAEVAEYIGNIFNCTADEGSDTLVSCLQEVDALKLAAASSVLHEWLLFPILLGPRVDGQYLPADIEFLMKEGRHKRVDLITGITKHDGAIFTTSKYSPRVSIHYEEAHQI
ncbi:Venom carboxylesterase-6 [Chionoecetes opilio]|uniref:Carboxylic ester hydrolase n=1 Tax=Chionoecetes opilio TaxID=41210 RepID=A0A8J4XY59_CHIOP|nr:Venom carboxylesterase-6 [Chionoecetes opilio]